MAFTLRLAPNIAHRSRKCGRTGEGLKASSAAEQLPPPGGSAPACERALYDWDDPDRRLAPDVVAASGDQLSLIHVLSLLVGWT